MSEVKRYKKKPVEIDALQFSGHNFDDVRDFVGNKVHFEFLGENATVVIAVIKTLEGDMVASKDDFIIRGVNGEFYPCKPDIFAKTYEPV